MHSADRIRNVALVGHRGSGKTSLHEALLFQAGAINRLGSVTDGTTVSDSDPDEQARQMSICAALELLRVGRPQDQPPRHPRRAELRRRRARRAARVRVGRLRRQRRDGRRGLHRRLWERAAELDLARMLFVNMLDRERADFFRTLEPLKGAFGQHVVATEIPIGSEHDVRGVIDLVDMKAYEYDGAGARQLHARSRSPTSIAAQAEEYREKLMDEVAEVSDALMERYLEGEEISHEEIVAALKEGTNHGGIFPVVCGVATRNLGTNRLLDAIVEDLPSPVKHGGLELPEITLEPDPRTPSCSPTSSRPGRPVRRPHQPLPRLPGRRSATTAQVLNTRAHAKERIGQLLVSEGKDSRTPTSSAPATSAPWPSSRRRAPATGSPSATSRA